MTSSDIKHSLNEARRFDELPECIQIARTNSTSRKSRGGSESGGIGRRYTMTGYPLFFELQGDYTSKNRAVTIQHFYRSFYPRQILAFHFTLFIYEKKINTL